MRGRGELSLFKFLKSVESQVSPSLRCVARVGRHDHHAGYRCLDLKMTVKQIAGKGERWLMVMEKAEAEGK